MKAIKMYSLSKVLLRPCILKCFHILFHLTLMTTVRVTDGILWRRSLGSWVTHMQVPNSNNSALTLTRHWHCVLTHSASRQDAHSVCFQKTSIGLSYSP